MSLKTMLTKSLHRAENGNATFHCAPFSANFLTKFAKLRACWCSGGCSPSACCFSATFPLETVTGNCFPASCAAEYWAIFHCAPFSTNSLAKLVGARCRGGGGLPSLCAWAAGTLLALLFAFGLCRVCFSCRATVPAEHSARLVFVLVAGLTELIACFALALQNPHQQGLLRLLLLQGCLDESIRRLGCSSC